MSSKSRLTINISQDERAKIAEMADRCHVSAAWIGRQAVREFLARCRHTPAGLVIPTSGKSNGGKRGFQAKA